jgi:hypothetical protein
VRVELVDPQGTILAEIADARLTRDDVAMTYAFCLRSPDGIDFAAINRAILGRWSMHALAYIKTEAWRIAEGRA